MKVHSVNNETIKIGKGGKIALWAGAGVITVGAVWFFFFRKKDTEPDITTSASSSSASGSKRRFSCRYTGFPLRFGTCGSEVKTLQRKLNAKGAGLNVDGKFGQNTETAAKKYAMKSMFTKTQLKSLT